MSVCPTCGQPLPLRADPKAGDRAATIRTADELVAAMRRAGHDGKTCDVYIDKDSRGYWITSGHERVHSAAVGDAIERRLIVQTYPSISGSWSLPERAAECHRLWAEHERRKAARHRP